MTLDSVRIDRLRFLTRVARRESEHLQATDSRLFALPFTVERVRGLAGNALESERVDAFVSRFGRLQDTLGNKLLPNYLEAVGEAVGAMLDNLDRAERLKLVPSADRWLAMRHLRNQMVHDYIEDPEILHSALQNGHAFVPVLVQTYSLLLAAMQKRGWVANKGVGYNLKL